MMPFLWSVYRIDLRLPAVVSTNNRWQPVNRPGNRCNQQWTEAPVVIWPDTSGGLRDLSIERYERPRIEIIDWGDEEAVRRYLVE